MLISLDKLRLKSLHKLRGLAALAVTVSHLGHWGGGAGFWAVRLISFGAQAVGVFFVISGFIIARSHRDEIGKLNCLGGYSVKRFLRIYPLYWVYSAIFLTMGCLGFKTWDISNIHPRNVLQMLSAILLLPIGHSASGFLIVSWSLFYEILFYLIFSTFFLNRKFGFISIFAFMAVSLVNHHFWLVPVFGFSYVNLLFLVGVLIGFNSESLKRLRIPAQIILLFGSLCYVIAMCLRPEISWPIAYISAICLVAGSVLSDEEIGNRAPSVAIGWFEKALLWLGTVSYSLYLCHVPMQTLVHSIVGSPYASIASASLFILVPIAMASCTYLWVEFPMQTLARHLTRKKPAIVPAVIEELAYAP